MTSAKMVRFTHPTSPSWDAVSLAASNRQMTTGRAPARKTRVDKPPSRLGTVSEAFDGGTLHSGADAYGPDESGL